MPAAADILSEVRSRALAPRKRESVAEWADRCRRLRTSAGLERHDTLRTPYIRGVYEAWLDPRVTQIALMFATQTGKTEGMLTCLLYDVANRPADAIFSMANETQARRVARGRLFPSIYQSPEIRACLIGRERDQSITEVQFAGMTLYMAWAQSEAQLASIPASHYFGDEIDKWPAGAKERFLQRVKASHEPKGMLTSSPSNAGEGIAQEYAESDQRRYWVPCPHCLQYQILKIRQLHVEGAEGLVSVASAAARSSGPEAIAALATAVYICRHCGGEIRDQHKPWMLRSGAWAAQGQRVEAGEVVSREIVRSEKASPSHDLTTHDLTPLVIGEPERNPMLAGFQLSSLYSPFAASTFGHMAAALAKTRYRMTPEYVQDWLGEGWQEPGEKVDAEDLKKIVVDLDEGGYRMGEVPAWCRLLLFGADVQSDGCYVVVRAFGGGREALVLHEFVPAPLGLGLDNLDRIFLNKRWAGANRRFARIVDSGYRTDEVYEYCRRRKSCFAAKGQDRMTEKVRVQRIERFPASGKTIPGGVQVLHVNTGLWKQDLMSAMRLAHEEAQHRDRFGVPVDVGEEWLLQVTSEHLVRERKKNTGAHRLEWRLRPGRDDNHYLDAEVYVRALAEFIGWRAG